MHGFFKFEGMTVKIWLRKISRKNSKPYKTIEKGDFHF